MLILIPPQVYTQRIFDGDFGGSFLAWYPHTFQGTYSMSDPTSGNLSWHHLWFLAYLFVFSLLLIPAFWYFKNDKRKALLSTIADFLEKPGALFLPAVPLIIINITLRPIFGWGTQNLISDWANFLFYILIFFYGFLMVSDKRVLLTIQHNKFISLIAAAVVSFFIYLIKVDILVWPAAYTIYVTAAAIACWYWLMALIGFGSLLFNASNAVLKYASGAVLPVYILHQTIIVTLGYFVIQLNTGVAPKYFLMVLATLAISLGIYEIVRRINVTRFLFGIKIKKAAVVRQTASGITPVS